MKASFLDRLVAMLIDGFIFNSLSSFVFAPFWCIFTFLPLLFTNSRSGLSVLSILFFCIIGVVLMIVLLALTYAYYIYFPVKKYHGATLGKRALRIKIVKEDGSELTQTDMFIREVVGKFMSGFAFNLGYLWALVDDRSQTWHDKIAKTLVVEE